MECQRLALASLTTFEAVIRGDAMSTHSPHQVAWSHQQGPNQPHMQLPGGNESLEAAQMLREMPGDGYSGLSHPTIHSLVEGLPSVELCEGYAISREAAMLEEMENELERRTAAEEEARTIDQRLQRRLHAEQLYYPRKRAYNYKRHQLPPLPESAGFPAKAVPLRSHSC